MKNINIDIKKIIKENYKIIIPITLIIVIFIAFFVYYQISINSDYRVDKEEKVYQYFNDEKYEYTSTISKNRKEVIVDYQPKDININLDSTPIYYQNGNITILAKDMSVVMPTLNCSEYLSKGYSYITYANGIYTLTTENYNKKLNHYFLYDGTDLYFFIEPVTLTVGQVKVELSPLSYVIARYGKYISYYDKKTDTAKTIETTDVNSLIKNEYYSIYITRDTIDYHGTNIILTSTISRLNTIDKKD